MSKYRVHIAETWVDGNGELLSTSSHTETVEGDNEGGAKQVVTDYLAKETPEDGTPYVQVLGEVDPSTPITFPPEEQAQ